MDDRLLKHGTVMKKGIYKKSEERRETHLRDKYIELARTRKKNVRRTKGNYEIGITRLCSERR